MEIIFEKEYLRELYLYRRTNDKKHWFQPQIVNKYIKVIKMMSDAPEITRLMQINSLNYEKLQGRKKGISSVRVNNQYRIEFKEECSKGEQKVSICNIIELSNHYK